MGIFEKPEAAFGTKAVFEALGAASGYTVVGGGDSVTAAAKYQVKDKLGYVCTGGGALIRFLTGEELPVVKALRGAAQRFGGRARGWILDTAPAYRRSRSRMKPCWAS